ncbi:hypothetical protein [Mycobacterium sp. URHB0021]
MEATTETRTLADMGGLVVTDDGRRVLVIDRRTGALSVMAFVLGVIALVVGDFGWVATHCERWRSAADRLCDLAHTGNEMPTMWRFACNGQVFP